MRTPATAVLFALSLAGAMISAPTLSIAGPASDGRVDEFKGVLFATTPAEEWRSVWSDRPQASQIRKPRVVPAQREALQNGCEALGSIVTELGTISGRCVT